MKPTEEQMKFWEWCGFEKQLLEDLPKSYRHEGNLGWKYPTDSIGVADTRKQLPDIDLNNLFKYAVPKLRRELSQLELATLMLGWLKAMFEDDEDPALALFWAINKVINEEM